MLIPEHVTAVMTIRNTPDSRKEPAMIRTALFCVFLSALFTLFCELPPDPHNVGNATFQEENLTALPDSIPQNLMYSCTLTVRFPEFIDSFSVFRSVDNGTPVKFAGSIVEDNDTLLVFPVPFLQPGQQTVSVYLYKNILTDTLTNTVNVFSTHPSITADVTRFTVVPGDSVTLRFEASDPDSNLLEYHFGRNGTITDTIPFLAGERSTASVEKTIPATLLKQFSDTVSLFTFTVMDFDSQTSPTLLCSLVIRDTLSPGIDFIPPLADTGYTVAGLPDTLLVKIRDNWGIDSMKYSGKRTVFHSDDTLMIVIGDLDSGKTVDSVEAWDRAGNRSVSAITLNYSGPRIFPAKIATIFHTVDEHESFDTIHLDDRVTITDTAATYGKESLRWSITVDSADSGMAYDFDSLNRTLVVSGPDEELFYNRILVLTLEVTDPNSVTSVLHGATFIMIEKDDPPVITYNGQRKLTGTQFDTLRLDTLGHDPEKKGVLQWSITRGDYFYPESTYILNCPSIRGKDPIAGCYLQFTGKIRILPDSAAIGGNTVVNDTLLFTLKNIVAGDTSSVSAKVPFSWYSFVVIPLDTLKLIPVEF